ncbi:MAG: ATP-binding protein [Erysipelotrichaceae bacterium]|nr:ATP-binding protein [Erysipelotrichaceae bacterium]
MLARDIMKQLVDWKLRNNHHPLILSGLRQVGKTYIVRQFGHENYRNVVYMDFRSNKSLHTVFEGDFDVNRMVSRITALLFDATFVPSETLVIMDEIQDCPNARSSLKYWDLDGRYDVIATGSFLGVKGFRKPYQRGIPVGYEEHMTMFPLTFREFLNNYGMPQNIIEYVQQCINESKVIDAAIHERMRDLYFEYLVVGGMPEAVNEFMQHHDINAVRSIQKRILDSIRDDLGRYIDSNGNENANEVLKLRAEACLDSLPAQLSKEYKKFQYSNVDNKAHSDDKADALQYLADLGLVVKAYNLRELSSPLEANKISKEYKAYYADTGLLVSQLGNDAAAKILNGDIGAYKGAIAENVVALALYDNNRKLYYYRGSSGAPELDFVADIDGEITIIECKSSNGKATSMKYVLQHPQKYGKHSAIKIADTNIGNGELFKTYPLYYTGFLKESYPANILKKISFDDLKIPER